MKGKQVQSSPLEDRRFADWFEGVVLGLQMYAVIGGLVSVIVWVTDAPRLTDWYNNGVSIQPNTAIATITASAALILLISGFRRAAAALGAFVALIGGS